MSKILVVGSSVVDLTFYTKTIPAVGQTVLGKFIQGLGGKGFNQAVGCALSGAKTAFLSATGPMNTDAFSPLFAKRLGTLGVEFSFEEIQGAATGAAAISVDFEGRNNIIVSLGANEKLSQDFLTQKEDFFKNVSVVLFQFETNFEAIEQSIKLIKQHSLSAKVVLNPAPAIKNIPSYILNNTDIFTPNETELEIISGVKIQTDSDLKKACEAVRGPKSVLATLGEKGCYYFDSITQKSYPAFKVEAKDTSGAGDAFNGGLASGLLRFPNDLNQAIRFASAVAAISVTRAGTSASMPTLLEVESFLEKNK